MRAARDVEKAREHAESCAGPGNILRIVAEQNNQSRHYQRAGSRHGCNPECRTVSGLLDTEKESGKAETSYDGECQSLRALVIVRTGDEPYSGTSKGEPRD